MWLTTRQQRRQRTHEAIPTCHFFVQLNSCAVIAAKMQANAVNSEQVALECCHPTDIGPRHRDGLPFLASQVCNREAMRVKGDGVVIVGRVWRNTSRLFPPESFNFGSRLFQTQSMASRNIPAEVKDVWHTEQNGQKADKQDFWEVRINHTHSFAA
jgi:hypothetical protein